MDASIHTAPHTVDAIAALSDKRIQDIISFMASSSQLQLEAAFPQIPKAELAAHYISLWRKRHCTAIQITSNAGLEAMAIVEPLDWDTKLLGVSSARVHYSGISNTCRTKSTTYAALIELINQVARDNKFHLMDARVSTRELMAMRFFEEANFHTVDVLVTLGAGGNRMQKILDQHPQAKWSNPDTLEWGNGITIHPILPSEVDVMTQLSIDAFGETDMIQDRFFLEPSLDHNRVQNLFGEWFRNSVKKQLSGDGVVLVAELNQKPID